MKRERGSFAVPVVVTLGIGVAGLVVSAIGAVQAGRPSTPSANSAAPINGYPQRIAFERPSPRLPDRPGPLAATMYDNDFGNGRNLGVGSHGQLWELPPGVNALSPDGGLLLTTDSSQDPGRLVVRDLSTGGRREFPRIGQTVDVQQRGAFRYLLDPNAPIYWSADGSRLLARFDERPRPYRSGRTRVLDVVSGRLTTVSGDEPAGFRSSTQAVTVTRAGSDRIVVTTTDLVTGDTRDLPLRLARPWEGNPNRNLVATVSEDGSRLLLVEDGAGKYPNATLRLFSLANGREVGRRSVADWDRCSPLTWRGADPVVATRSQRAGSELVTADGPKPLVAVHPRLQSSCLSLTAGALAAGAHRALFGTWTYLWTWYWWQLLLALSLALLAVGGLLWLRRSTT